LPIEFGVAESACCCLREVTRLGTWSAVPELLHSKLFHIVTEVMTHRPVKKPGNSAVVSSPNYSLCGAWVTVFLNINRDKAINTNHVCDNYKPMSR